MFCVAMMASSSFFVTHLHVEPEAMRSTCRIDFLTKEVGYLLDRGRAYFEVSAPCAVVQVLTVVDNSASTCESVLPERFNT